MTAYRCRMCGTRADSAVSPYTCGHCETVGAMIPDTPSATVTMPRECPDHVLAACPELPAGDVVSLYSKFVRLAGEPKP